MFKNSIKSKKSSKSFVLKFGRTLLKPLKAIRSAFVLLFQALQRHSVTKLSTPLCPRNTKIMLLKYAAGVKDPRLFSGKQSLSVNRTKNEVLRFFCTRGRKSGVAWNMHSVLGELKYRILYVGLLSCCLVGLIYLNLGLYIEFQWAYYFNYYQFIDFDWYEGIRELNKSLHPKKPATYLTCTEEAGSGLFPLNPFFEGAVDFKKSIVDQVAAFFTTLQKLQEVALTILDPWDKKASLAEQWREGSFNYNTTSPQNTHYEKVNVEIDEFNSFFISIVGCFSGQLAIPLLELPSSTSEITQTPNRSPIFGLYIMLIFYQLATFIAYHCFCFLGPGVLNQSRIRLFRLLQTAFILFLFHFLATPYIVATNQELQIEGIDSELFFAANLDLLNSWIWCFYILLIFLLTFCFYRVIKTNYNKIF